MGQQNYKQIIQMDDAIIKKFDTTVKSCVSAMTETHYSIMHSMTLLTGIDELKQFFNQPQIKDLMESAKGNEAGFLTDEKTRKIPYTHDQIIDALIPRILEGYRITGNEINIIAGKGMAVKRGKFRRIIEMTDSFAPTIGSPQQKNNQSTFKCVARWTKDGKDYSIGIGENDPCLITIKSGGPYDTIDKLIGLAESKLYTRVLTRLTGNFIDEEAAATSPINITDEAEDAANTVILKKTANLKVADKPFEKEREPSSETKEKPPVQQKTEQDEPKLHPVVAKIKKMFEDEEGYLDIFDLMEEEKMYSKSRIKTIILDNDADAAVILTQEIQAVLAR